MRVFFLFTLLTAISLSAEPLSSKTLRAKKTFKVQKHLIIDGDKIRHKPGDIFAVKAGKMEKLTIKNFKGAAEKPVIFINKGGVVEIDNKSLRGGAVDIMGCKHIRFSGLGAGAAVSPATPGDPRAMPCGFRIRVGKNGPHALNVINRSSDVEIDHIEVFGAGFAGFNVKDEPRKDGSTNRENFTMYNISIHDNHIHQTIGEGFYIGHTFYTGYDPQKTGKPLMPHVIRGLRVYNNYLHDTGCEAIQVGSTIEDCEIYCNTMLRTGRKPFAKYQNNGLQIGSGTQAKVYSNYIEDVPACGMSVFGLGNIYVYNNIIVNTGESGIYNNTKGGKSYHFIHNTIVNCKKSGITIGNWEGKITVEAFNNLIVASGAGINNQNRKAPLKDSGNYVSDNMRQVSFEDATKNLYGLSVGSKARKCGVKFNVSFIKADFRGEARSGSRSRSDAGALIYKSGQKLAFPGAVYTITKPTPWLNKKH